MKLQKLVIASALAALAMSSGAEAQTPSPAMSTAANTSGAASPADRKFVEHAGKAGLAEVQMAKAAQQRGSTEVKSFADKMVADHGKANEELKAIATKKGIVVPDTLAAKDARELSKLQKLAAAAFDKEYVASQVAAHKDAVNLFKKESAAGKDADLKAFASSTLPTLQEHLTMITSMSKKTH